MKLNKKGYMLVEIIIAVCLAMSIAYYLLNLTYKFKNLNEDIYYSNTYIQSKNLITKNIMNDLERGEISNVIANKINNGSNITNTIIFDLTINNNTEKRKLEIKKEDVTTIEYGKIKEDNTFDINDISYYKKELEESLIVSNVDITTDNNTFSITIPIKAMYTEDNYDIIILSPTYNYSNSTTE